MTEKYFFVTKTHFCRTRLKNFLGTNEKTDFLVKTEIFLVFTEPISLCANSKQTKVTTGGLRAVQKQRQTTVVVRH